jgi:hypothetical protein
MDRSQNSVGISRPHFHIRWEKRPALDWECFPTYREAAERANELAGPNEIFTIEEVMVDCPLLSVTPSSAPQDPPSHKQRLGT